MLCLVKKHALSLIRTYGLRGSSSSNSSSRGPQEKGDRRTQEPRTWGHRKGRVLPLWATRRKLVGIELRGAKSQCRAPHSRPAALFQRTFYRVKGMKWAGLFRARVGFLNYRAHRAGATSRTASQKGRSEKKKGIGKVPPRVRKHEGDAKPSKSLAKKHKGIGCERPTTAVGGLECTSFLGPSIAMRRLFSTARLSRKDGVPEGGYGRRN